MRSVITGGRSRLHLVVLGHVDAGKSTLMGRLLADLGVVTQKQVHCPAKLSHVGNEPLVQMLCELHELHALPTSSRDTACGCAT